MDNVGDASRRLVQVVEANERQVVDVLGKNNAYGLEDLPVPRPDSKGATDIEAVQLETLDRIRKAALLGAEAAGA